MFSNLFERKINFLIMFMSISLSQTILCPSMCSCIWRNGKQTSICEKQGLIAVPTDIPSSTQVLNISENNLQILPSRVFQKLGLINLQKLFLSKCKLGMIATDSFVQLTNLVELDLNNNLLTSIPSESLKECIFLRRLTLHSNPYRQIKYEAFLNLKKLVFLDLSMCQIEQIDSHAFRGLNNLQFLKLDSNKLQTLAPTVVSDMSALYSLDLHQNQWNCDCELRPSREWMISNKVSQSVWPQCKTPQRLEGISWNSLEIDEFSCLPKLDTKSTQFWEYMGNNITIECSASGLPLPSINWYFHYGFGQNLSKLNNRVDRYSALEQRNQTVLTSFITIIDLKLEDSQHCICSAQNSRGIVYKNFTLTVLTLPKPNQSIIWTQLEIGGAIVVLVFSLLLISSIITVIVIRSKGNSLVHTSLDPKLAPIDVLQRVQISEFKIKNSSEPEIAFLFNVINDEQIENERKAHGYTSGVFLQKPDVVNTGSPNYSYNQIFNTPNIRVNLDNNYHHSYQHNSPQILNKSNNTFKSYSHTIYAQNLNTFSDTESNLNEISSDQQLKQILNPLRELDVIQLLERSSFATNSNHLNNVQTHSSPSIARTQV